MARSRRRSRPHAAPASPSQPSAPAQAGPLWRLSPGVLAALTALLVYLPSLGGGFLYDDVNVTAPSFQRLSDLRAVLLYEPARPLLSVTWALNYALGGPAPWTYHLVNVLIHAANAALLASLFVWIGTRLAWPHVRQRALLAACLFAASPMAAETVAYVSSRSTALATLFSLAALNLVAPILSGGPRWRLAPAVLLHVAALATKEEAATLPVLLLALDLFLVARWQIAGLRRRIGVHLPFVALVALGIVARRLATGAWLPSPAIDRGQYLLTQWSVFPLYFLRSLLPIDPALYRGQPPASWPPNALTIAGSLATVALLALAFHLRRRRGPWALAVVWLGVCLLPSSSLLPLAEMLVDHRAYMGMALVLLALAGLWRPGRTWLAAVVLALFCLGSWRYEWILADAVRAWEDAARRAPHSALARRSLADAYVERGDFARAEVAFREAVGLAPAEAANWTNLGVFLARRGRLAEAETALRQALRLRPDGARAHENLALVLEAGGRTDEAATAYETASRLDPYYAAPRIDLANLLIRRGQPARAAALLDEASRLPLAEADRAIILALRQRLAGPPPRTDPDRDGS